MRLSANPGSLSALVRLSWFQLRVAEPPDPDDNRANREPFVLSAGRWPGGRPVRRLLGMPHDMRLGLGEAAVTATLLSIYVCARGTSRALGVAQAAMSGLPLSQGSPPAHAVGAGRNVEEPLP